MANTRYKSIDDVLSEWASITDERRSVRKGENFFYKEVCNVDGEDREVTDTMTVSVKELLGGNVNTEIRFPPVKRGGKSWTKIVSFAYQKTPEGLVLKNLDSSESKHVIYDGEIVLLSSLKKQK